MHLFYISFLEQVKAALGESSWVCVCHTWRVPRLDEYDKISGDMTQGSSQPPMSKWWEDRQEDVQVYLDAGCEPLPWTL